MEDSLIKLGAGGLLAIMILKEVFAFLKALIANRTPPEKAPTVEQWILLEKQMEALYEMHHKFTQDGSPVWYVKQSYYEKADKGLRLLEEIFKNTDITKDHLNMQSRLIEGVIDRIRALEKNKP